jgi:hypothetical protein
MTALNLFGPPHSEKRMPTLTPDRTGPRRPLTPLRGLLSAIVCLGLAAAAAAAAAEDRPAVTLMDAVTRAVAQTPEVALARESLAYKHAQVQIDRG